jgi:hypothetical protein
MKKTGSGIHDKHPGSATLMSTTLKFIVPKFLIPVPTCYYLKHCCFRQKNSLLAVGKNLAQLPDGEEGVCPAFRKRTRSLSPGREEEGGLLNKLSRTRSVGREPDQLAACSSLIQLGQVRTPPPQGCGSGSGIQIRIQEGKNDPQK